MMVDFSRVFERIEALIKQKPQIIVAIDGMCGSGKTTLAGMISEKYDCNVFHTDDYFLRPVQKTPQRFDEVGGNFDYERFFDEVVTGIRSGKPFVYGIFDCQAGKICDTKTASPKQLNIIEGVYSLHPFLGEIYDLKLFLYLDCDKQKKRVVARSGESMWGRFENEWIPKENAYFNKFNIKPRCDIIIDTAK